jgi:NADPH-dependent curcumin reductase CurA
VSYNLINLKVFPENVLNTSNFIIEEFIRGEEYAIDYYYDNNGAVLLNVLHHLFSSEQIQVIGFIQHPKQSLKSIKLILNILSKIVKSYI